MKAIYVFAVALLAAGGVFGQTSYMMMPEINPRPIL